MAPTDPFSTVVSILRIRVTHPVPKECGWWSGEEEFIELYEYIIVVILQAKQWRTWSVDE